MRSRSLCALLLTTAGALVMSSALMGGCFKPEDTFVNYSNASSSSAGVGGAGGTAPTIDTPKDYFEIEVKPDMVAMCGEGCHSSGEVPFLTVGIEYESISSYITKKVAKGSAFLVPNPAQSILIVYPDTPEHSGLNWDEGAGDLRTKTLEWLDREAELLEPDSLLEVGPITPNGFVVLPLDSLKPELEDYSMSFYGTPHGDPPALLELTDIAMWPPNGRGLRVDNITFVVQPTNTSVPVLDTSFHGDPQIFVAPSSVQVGPGELLLSSWGTDYTLSVRFDDLQALFADEFGDTFAPCTRVDLFAQGVEALAIQPDSNDSNGLLYCADQCHGGAKGATPASVMKLSELFMDPPDYDFACAKTRAFITPTNPNNSAIISSTDPTGDAAHKVFFQFGGNIGAHAAFRSAMEPWIDEEGAAVEE